MALSWSLSPSLGVPAIPEGTRETVFPKKHLSLGGVVVWGVVAGFIPGPQPFAVSPIHCQPGSRRSPALATNCRSGRAHQVCSERRARRPSSAHVRRAQTRTQGHTRTYPWAPHRLGPHARAHRHLPHQCPLLRWRWEGTPPRSASPSPDPSSALLPPGVRLPLPRGRGADGDPPAPGLQPGGVLAASPAALPYLPGEPGFGSAAWLALERPRARRCGGVGAPGAPGASPAVRGRRPE